MLLDAFTEFNATFMSAKIVDTKPRQAKTVSLAQSQLTLFKTCCLKKMTVAHKNTFYGVMTLSRYMLLFELCCCLSFLYLSDGVFVCMGGAAGEVLWLRCAWPIQLNDVPAVGMRWHLCFHKHSWPHPTKLAVMCVCKMSEYKFMTM